MTTEHLPPLAENYEEVIHELVDALKNIVARVTWGPVAGNQPYIAPAWNSPEIVAARAAIAKAEGRDA